MLRRRIGSEGRGHCRYLFIFFFFFLQHVALQSRNVGLRALFSARSTTLLCVSMYLPVVPSAVTYGVLSLHTKNTTSSPSGPDSWESCNGFQGADICMSQQNSERMRKCRIPYETYPRGGGRNEKEKVTRKLKGISRPRQELLFAPRWQNNASEGLTGNGIEDN